MPVVPASQQEQKKPFSVAVMRIGTHPVVYSVMIIAVTSLLLFFLVAVPMVRKLQSGGSASVSDAQNRKLGVENSLESEKKLVNLAKSLTAKDRELLSYALPLEQQIPELSVIMKSVAIASGVKMTSLDIAQASQSSGEEGSQALGRLQVTVSLDLVTYDRLKIILTNTENSLRLFDLRSMTFSPSTGSVNMQFDTYYLNSI